MDTRPIIYVVCSDRHRNGKTLLARAGEIRQPKRRQSLQEHAELARLSRRLVRLEDQAPLPLPLAALGVKAPDPEHLLAFLRAQAFRDRKSVV